MGPSRAVKKVQETLRVGILAQSVIMKKKLWIVEDDKYS